jgi:hypothetical protein
MAAAMLLGSLVLLLRPRRAPDWTAALAVAYSWW